MLRAASEWIGEALVALGVSTADERTPSSFDETDYAMSENCSVRPRFGVLTCLTGYIVAAVPRHELAV